MRVNDVSCNCPEYGGQVRHNTGCPLGGWHPSQTMGTTTRPMPRTEAARHRNDSYGACVICREYVPNTEDDMVTVAWPCAVVREAEAVAAERARIRDAVEGLLFEAIMDGRGGVRDSIDRAAVLAIIDKEDTDGG